MKPQALTTDGYRTLVRKIRQELDEIERFFKQRAAQGAWNVGKYIHEHLLHQKKAEHNSNFYERLAEDVGRDSTTLRRSVQFFLTYPKCAIPRNLTLEHLRNLMTIQDKRERKVIEQKVIRGNWTSLKLRNYLTAKRKLISAKEDDKPVPQLTFTRGKLHTYQIIKANQPLAGKSPLVLDLGFREEHVIPKKSPSLKEGDLAELLFEDGELIGAQKSTISKDELFTYKAYVTKVTDADTLIVAFDFQLDHSVGQKLRLRGINCPEIDTPEGQRAKRFVENRLNPNFALDKKQGLYSRNKMMHAKGGFNPDKHDQISGRFDQSALRADFAVAKSGLKGCEFIIVKTYKDRSDKFDRYLADIFYQEGEDDPALVAAQGTFLNQELLDEHLACVY